MVEGANPARVPTLAPLHSERSSFGVFAQLIGGAEWRTVSLNVERGPLLKNRRIFAAARIVAIAGLMVFLLQPAQSSYAQVGQGATMTVLAGQVGVVRPDGSAMQPAPSPSDVFPGDEIRTLTQSGALITFFAGTEVELGADTVLVVQTISRPGDRVDITLRQVAGTSVSRVQSIIDSGGGYRVEAGGSVALVRG